MGAALNIPFGLAANGRTATTGDDDHIRDMIKAVLFTAPGERVNRPEFGCGLQQLVFAPLGETLVATTQQLVQGSLLRWLGSVIVVDLVEIEAQESTLFITVSYAIRATSESHVAVFERAIAS